MKIYLCILALLVTTACTSKRRSENLCFNQAIRSLQKPQNTSRTNLSAEGLERLLAVTHIPLQSCYEEFKQRSGIDEFNTCMVVGVDSMGKRDYYDFWSDDVEFDRAFYECTSFNTKNEL